MRVLETDLRELCTERDADASLWSISERGKGAIGEA